MRKFFAAAIAVAIVAVMTAPMFAESKTVKGELVDRACYVKDNTSKGADHLDCAQTCAKKGQAVALLAADGLYTVTGDLAANQNAKLVPHMSHTVELTGDVTEKGGQKMIAAASLKMISK